MQPLCVLCEVGEMKPDFLAQGEQARLFPVLATTSREGRTTSVFLSCLSNVEEFARDMLASIGQSVGKRGTIDAFTEVVFKGQASATNDRPDGLIVFTNGRKEWRALVEAKVGNAQLTSDQVERYRTLAKEHGLDAVITVSNQFASRPNNHPVEDVRKSRSKIPVFHWSWMYVLTVADLLLCSDGVDDEDQKVPLSEFHRFMSHESTGVKGFDRMPPEWTELNRLISAGGRIPAKSPLAEAVLEAWHQETKDLSLILSRQTETVVRERLPRKHAQDPAARLKDELSGLKDDTSLKLELDIPNAAAPLEIVADITRRTIDVGMALKAPEDKKSSKARLNWLLRQMKSSELDDLHIRLHWPGRSEATQFEVAALMEDPSICEEGKNGLQVRSFFVFMSRRLGGRFTQQVNFVSDLEKAVPEFYSEVGQFLVPWRQKAPSIKLEATEPEPSSVAEGAEATD